MKSEADTIEIKDYNIYSVLLGGKSIKKGFFSFIILHATIIQEGGDVC